MIIGIISWCVFGLIIGAIARLLMPGTQRMGLIMTILLGVVGSFTGGFISTLIFGGGDGAAMHPGGWIMSTIGACLVLFIASKMAASK
ncbi:hypothetical protein Pan258_32260 [Symmachiella dynata]|uniref:GlsB/YeaQ/YmgE family stress response membrane protein n=1 Tax=Symmachiella dynata TaxID=2527995 RepID=UPI00118D43A3|nr:GlsB/YeaQ/YmgE family stress response membrane protein [Symmachiella dynata]QDT49179.1 hypothetical protein Pan258_32260 [Symmachiella dynata]